MITPTFKIDGVEYVQHVLQSGFKWSRNDLDSDDAGRTLDSLMHRSRISTKRKLGVSLGKLTQEEISAIDEAIDREFVDVTYVDTRGVVTKTFYGSSIESTIQKFKDGEVYWEGTTFNLIER